MGFLQPKEYIEEKDTVIVYINPHLMYPIEVTRTKLNKKNEEVEHVFQTSFGCFNVGSLIGKPFGSKVTLVKGSKQGWAYVLRPTPELWTVTLPHRTQVIYTPDISMILFQLDLRPGKIVVEAGTGSGSLSHALARSVYPDGHVYTFDFHQTRVSMAENEFEKHGLSATVTVSQRDVCANGYGPNMDNIADAVFLDLPMPSQVIPYAVKCIKDSGGRIGSFSPCIEQVQKTSEVLRNLAFEDISVLECLQREFVVAPRTMSKLSLNCNHEPEEDNEKFVACIPPSTMPGHTGYLTFATLPPQWARSTKLLSIPIDIDADEKTEMSIEDDVMNICDTD